MPTVSPKLLIAFLSTVLLFVTTVTAQSGVCAIKMDVTPNGSETKISGATATAVNQKTKRVYRSTLRKGMPYFARLPEGEYRFTATKAGYQRSVDNFAVVCPTGTVEFGIELFTGSPTKTVRLYEKIQTTSPPRSEPTGGGEGRYDPSPATSGDVPRSISGGVPNSISGGVLNGKSTNLVRPAYPPAASAVKASGAVNVQVTIDEQGNVISATAVSGHPLLRAAAVKAARESTFLPTTLEGRPVKVTGVIVYNFVP